MANSKPNNGLFSSGIKFKAPSKTSLSGSSSSSSLSTTSNTNSNISLNSTNTTEDDIDDLINRTGSMQINANLEITRPKNLDRSGRKIKRPSSRKTIETSQENETNTINTNYRTTNSFENTSIASVNENQEVDDLADAVASVDFNSQQEPSPNDSDLDSPSHDPRYQLANSVFNDQARDEEVLNAEFSKGELQRQGLTVTLYPHQLLGLQFMQKREASDIKSGLICDDMGLGKTIQTLSLILENKRKENSKFIKTTLIVCPLSLIYQWEAEIKSKTEGLSCAIFHGTQRSQLLEKIPQYDIIISTYTTVKLELSKDSLFGNYEWHRVIFDEAHELRNSDTGLYKCISDIRSERIWALTGTPLHNDIYDIQSLLVLLGFDISKIQWSFLSIKESFRPDTLTTIENLKKLHELMSQVMIRRTKKILTKEQLNCEKRVHRKDIDFLPEEAKVYRAMAMIMRTSKDTKSYRTCKVACNIDSKLKSKVVSGFVMIMKLRQLCSHWKMISRVIPRADNLQSDIAMLEFVSGLKELTIKDTSGKLQNIAKILNQDPTRKTIIFSSFPMCFDDLSNDLMNLGFKTLQYHGSLKPEQKRDVIEEFSKKNSPPILLASIKATSVGLNLTMATRVIHYDPWWNPAIVDQASDRVYRIGQTKDVDVYEVCYKNSIEQKIYQLMAKKKELATTVVVGDDSETGNLFSKHQTMKLLDESTSLVEAY